MVTKFQSLLGLAASVLAIGACGKDSTASPAAGAGRVEVSIAGINDSEVKFKLERKATKLVWSLEGEPKPGGFASVEISRTSGNKGLPEVVKWIYEPLEGRTTATYPVSLEPGEYSCHSNMPVRYKIQLLSPG